MTQKNILIINGSPQGSKGNCHVLIKDLTRELKSHCSTTVVTLSNSSRKRSWKKIFQKCDACLFVTGTYWDSWGSPLQRMLEEMTFLEADPCLLGKPAAVMVLMHSVGGKEVVSRLQGVLSTLGFLIPPMSGMAYSLVSQLAEKSSHAADFWQREDQTLILENLKAAMNLNVKWKAWPVDRKDPRRRWLK